MRLLRLGHVLEKLARVRWGEPGIERVVLFGGLARRGHGRDADLLVLSTDGSPRPRGGCWTR